VGISLKHRRKIVVAAHELYWSVKQDSEWPYRRPVGSGTERVLSVVTADRRFVMELPIDRLREGRPDRALLLSGRGIRGRGASGARNLHVDVPDALVPDSDAVTPRFVRALVQWVLASHAADTKDTAKKPRRRRARTSRLRRR
jgi:hypothetical protein